VTIWKLTNYATLVTPDIVQQQLRIELMAMVLCKYYWTGSSTNKPAIPRPTSFLLTTERVNYLSYLALSFLGINTNTGICGELLQQILCDNSVNMHKYLQRVLRSKTPASTGIDINRICSSINNRSCLITNTKKGDASHLDRQKFGCPARKYTWIKIPFAYVDQLI
jgi:hypothetical protein